MTFLNFISRYFKPKGKYSRLEAAIDCMLLLERNEPFPSRRKLAEKWSWSLGNVVYFLKDFTQWYNNPDVQNAILTLEQKLNTKNHCNELKTNELQDDANVKIEHLLNTSNVKTEQKLNTETGCKVFKVSDLDELLNVKIEQELNTKENLQKTKNRKKTEKENFPPHPLNKEKEKEKEKNTEINAHAYTHTHTHEENLSGEETENGQTDIVLTKPENEIPPPTPSKGIQQSLFGDEFPPEDPEPKLKRFVKPKVEEIAAYIKEKNYIGIDAEQFFDFYESKGWKVGKSPMKDWRAAVRTWVRAKKQNYEQQDNINRRYHGRDGKPTDEELIRGVQELIERDIREGATNQGSDGELPF